MSSLVHFIIAGTNKQPLPTSSERMWHIRGQLPAAGCGRRSLLLLRRLRRRRLCRKSARYVGLTSA